MKWRKIKSTAKYHEHWSLRADDQPDYAALRPSQEFASIFYYGRLGYRAGACSHLGPARRMSEFPTLKEAKTWCVEQVVLARLEKA